MSSCLPTTVSAMATYDDVRDLGLTLPGVEESTSYGTPSLKVGGKRGKMIARLKEDGETLVVRCSQDEREILLDADPGAFTITDHYRDHDYVLVSLPAADPDLLDERLTEAWSLVAPAKLQQQLEER
jgi:hypothetical protein